MKKVKLNNEDFDFLKWKIYFLFKESYSLNFNPYMVNLYDQLEKNYNSKEGILKITEKNIDKILFVLNLYNNLETCKRHRKNLIFDYIYLSGFRWQIPTKAGSSIKFNRNKIIANRIISSFYKQTNIKPKKQFPKYILRYSLGKRNEC